MIPKIKSFPKKKNERENIWWEKKEKEQQC